LSFFHFSFVIPVLERGSFFVILWIRPEYPVSHFQIKQKQEIKLLQTPTLPRLPLSSPIIIFTLWKDWALVLKILNFISCFVLSWRGVRSRIWWCKVRIHWESGLFFMSSSCLTRGSLWTNFQRTKKQETKLLQTPMLPRLSGQAR